MSSNQLSGQPSVPWVELERALARWKERVRAGGKIAPAAQAVEGPAALAEPPPSARSAVAPPPAPRRRATLTRVPSLAPPPRAPLSEPGSDDDETVVRSVDVEALDGEAIEDPTVVRAVDAATLRSSALGDGGPRKPRAA
jgi:hypothetical protein